METIVVTRHPALVEYLTEIGLLPNGVTVLIHVTPEDVVGKHVIGVLPLHLAALADRGVELDLARMREIAGDPVTYRVTRCPAFLERQSTPLPGGLDDVGGAP